MHEVATHGLELTTEFFTLCAIPGAAHPVAGRDAQTQHALKYLAYIGKHFFHKADAVLKAAAVGVAALVGQRRQKLVQKVAVCCMELNGVDADAVGSLG
jgi:hypothetical protein